MTIQLVGHTSLEISTNVSSTTVSLASLTGGLASSPSQGDVVVVMNGWTAGTDGNPGLTSPSATELADLYSSPANFSVSYFVCGASPPSSITVSLSGVTGRGNITHVAVFRGVDLTNPIDVTTNTGTGTGTATATMPSITPVTAGACVIATACSSISTSTPGDFTGLTGSGYTTLRNTKTGQTSYVGMGSSYKIVSSGGVAENPGDYTNTTTGTSWAWTAVTLALRPIAGNIKAWSGSTWTDKPVKYWNGSAWVQKPLKRWNGSAWVSTTY